MPDAFIFDLDGVVTDTAELHYQAWQRLADTHGLSFDRAANERLKGVSRSASLRLMLGDRECADDAFNAMLEEKNLDYVKSLEQLGPDDILPGIPELLAALRSQNTPIAIASASRNARTILSRLGLDAEFAAVSDGHSVSNSKPAPDVFIHAAGQLGEQCDNCIVVEDAAAGVQAAKAAGMRVIGIGAHLESANPDQLVSSTDALYALIVEAHMEKNYGSN